MSKKAAKIDSIHLTVQYIKHKDGIIAYAPSLDLSTVGATFSSAQRMFKKAVDVFFEDLIERGTLTEVLSGLGWVRRQSSWNPPHTIRERSISLKLPGFVTA